MTLVGDPSPPPSPSPPSAPRRRLTTFDAAAIIVGIIIGAGFYETSPLVAASAGTTPALLGVWVAGGLVALVGALCYAELATAYPLDGGEYVYLSRAFGRGAGLSFAWASFWLIRPGNVGAMAYVFARYAQQLAPLEMGGYGFPAYAAGAVVVLTAANVTGARAGRWTQNLLTGTKVVGLLAVFAGGLLLLPATVAHQPAPPTVPAAGGTNLPLALILVMFAYGGWNEMAAVAAEVRNPRRNIPRALVIGTAGVVAVYLLGNLAFLRALGLAGLQQSDAAAADMLRPRLGQAAAAGISLLVCVSCLGVIHGMLLTGSRIFYAVGADHPAYAWLNRWNARRGAPVRSLLVQAAVTLALVLAVGRRGDGFERLVVVTGPLFFAFLLLAGIALFVLRRRDPDTDRPYRVTGYPVTPILFCLSSAFMLQASLRYAIEKRYWEGLVAVAVLATGVVASVAGRKHALSDLPDRSASP